MQFQEVTFDNKDLWHEWRKGGIGSSDASVIMDVSRFKSREELRIEKASGIKLKDESNLYVKERGNKIELFVRTALEDKHNTKYPPMNCINSVFSFMRASLDGISSDNNTIIEIKLLSIINPDKPNYATEGYKKWIDAYEQNKVPAEYYPQVMHQLMVTGAKKALFVGYKEVKGQTSSIEGNLAIVEVLPDKDYMRTLAAKEFEFWYQVQERRQEISIAI